MPQRKRCDFVCGNSLQPKECVKGEGSVFFAFSKVSALWEARGMKVLFLKWKGFGVSSQVDDLRVTYWKLTFHLTIQWDVFYMLHDICVWIYRDCLWHDGNNVQAHATLFPGSLLNLTITFEVTSISWIFWISWLKVFRLLKIHFSLTNNPVSYLGGMGWGVSFFYTYKSTKNSQKSNLKISEKL